MNRYSTLVSLVKVVLPLLALALLSTMFLFSRTPDPDAAIPFAEVDVAQIARDQRLSDPRFAGTLEDGREVTLVAAQALPDQDQPSLVTLDEIEGRVELDATEYLILNARAGTLDMTSQSADLDGDVTIMTSQGFRLSSDRMVLALNELSLVAPGTVQASGPEFNLVAGAMSLTGPEENSVLSFTGGVRLLYDLQE